MGTFVGHVAPGAGFCIIGLWHLLSTLRNFAQGGQWEFESRPWFPAKLAGKLKYMELYLIMVGSCLSIACELHFGLHGRPVLDDDGSIPWLNLNNFEHSSISLFFLLFATSALMLDWFQITVPYGFVHVLGALALAQELLIFHVHSADHMGLEGQYHWLLQLIIIVGMACVLLEIPCPHNVLIPIMRSSSLIFQGFWFIQMGFVVFTSSFVPKGCTFEEYMVICEDEVAKARAKALANLQFSWWLAGVVVLTQILYILVMKWYGKFHKYEALDQYMVRSMQGANSLYKANNNKSIDGSNSYMEELSAVEEGR